MPRSTTKRQRIVAHRAGARRTRKPAASGEPQLVYAGREQRGSIARRANRFVARDAAGRKIGTFATAKQAFSAVLAAPIKGAA